MIYWMIILIWTWQSAISSAFIFPTEAPQQFDQSNGVPELKILNIEEEEVIDPTSDVVTETMNVRSSEDIESNMFQIISLQQLEQLQWPEDYKCAKFSQTFTRHFIEILRSLVSYSTRDHETSEVFQEEMMLTATRLLKSKPGCSYEERWVRLVQDKVHCSKEVDELAHELTMEREKNNNLLAERVKLLETQDLLKERDVQISKENEDLRQQVKSKHQMIEDIKSERDAASRILQTNVEEIQRIIYYLEKKMEFYVVQEKREIVNGTEMRVVVHGNTSYFFSTGASGAKSWHDARLFCLDNNLTLAVLLPSDLDTLMTKLRDIDQINFWVNGHFGNGTWNAGLNETMFNTTSQELNQDEGNDVKLCPELRTVSGDLQSAPCSTEQSFVCETTTQS